MSDPEYASHSYAIAIDAADIDGDSFDNFHVVSSAPVGLVVDDDEAVVYRLAGLGYRVEHFR